jgi:hypothetical protein
MRDEYKLLFGNLNGKEMGGEDDIKMDLRGTGGDTGLHSTGSGYGPMTDFCEHGNEHFGSV